MMDEDLPPLPPPLPPTHSRSFSSSSSSSAGSPQPPPSEWPRKVGANSRNGVDQRVEEEDNSYLSPRNGRAQGAGSSSPAMRRTASQISSDGSIGSTRDPNYPRSTPTSSRPSPRSSQFRSTSSSSAIPNCSEQPLTSQQQRTRATNFLSKVSPSLSSHSRYSNSPSNIASLGLRGSPEPLGLGIGSGGFSRVMGGLPSPPPTNSDEGSNEGDSRYGTLRASELDREEHRDTERTESGGRGGNVSPLKPDRPPKSERRSTWTPTKDGIDIPAIGRTSPTILISSNGAPGSSSSQEFRTSRSVSSFQQSSSPSPRPSSLTPSQSLGSLDQHSHDGSNSDTMEELRDGLAGVEPRRRLKARTTSSEADPISDTGDAERRRERQGQRANELREKNQRILDSINSQLVDPLSSPPSSQRGISPSPSSSEMNLPRRTVQRSSTSSTIRDLAAGEDDLLQGTQPNFSNYGSTDDDEPGQVRSQQRNQKSVSNLEEFGVPADNSMRRSATVGDISSQDSGFDRELRARTAGFRSRPRTSLLRQALDDEPSSSQSPLPERSATSMSSYPSTIERIRARRSDLVGSDRTRAASSFSDTRQQDQEFSEGMRRLASRELLRTPRDRSKPQTEALNSPSAASQSHSNDSISSATLRNRPALPSEFRHSPAASSSSISSSSRITPRRSLDASSARLTPSSSSSRDLDRFARSRSAVSSLASPISPSASSTSMQSAHRQARSEVSFESDYSIEGGEDEERETTPKSAKKSTFDRIGSVGRARTSLGHAERRANSVSEAVDRPHSRMSREGRRNGLKSPDTVSRGTATPPLPPSARSEDRYSNTGDLAARKERLKNAEVGSEAWMAELDNLRNRGTRSRASDTDGRSTIGSHAGRLPSEAERDRTVRAINALLAGQGIVASAVDPTSPASSTFSKDTSPRKRESYGNYDRSRRISFANGTREDSQLPPGSNTMSRSNSNTSRNDSEPLLREAANQSASLGDHHKLLLSSFEFFDRHFSADGPETPESVELVKRMVSLISSTTKLNTGIRALNDAIKEEQIQAQLDEGQRNSTVSLTQFEKNVHALLRTSDDQVRSLSEDLIAITRVDRERDRLRREQEGGGGGGRPLSRASNIDQSPSKPLPRRPTTASSVLDGATVSLASSRSPNVPREVLRNPLEDPSDSLPASSRRGTLNYSGRSPFALVGTDSPTPASRQSGSTSEIPIRRGSISTSSTYSSGTASRPSQRRGKSSDPTRSPTQTGAVPFPTANSSVPIPRVDSTPALSNDSPTRNSHFPKRPIDGPSRTYSGASGDAIAHEALELAANIDEARTRSEREAALDRLETARSQSPFDERRSIVSATPTSESRRPRTRSSMGAIGSALKNAFTPKKKGASESPAGISSSTSTSSFYSRDSVDSTGGRDERRREVENILRRTASRT